MVRDGKDNVNLFIERIKGAIISKGEKLVQLKRNRFNLVQSRTYGARMNGVEVAERLVDRAPEKRFKSNQAAAASAPINEK